MLALASLLSVSPLGFSALTPDVPCMTIDHDDFDGDGHETVKDSEMKYAHHDTNNDGIISLNEYLDWAVHKHEYPMTLGEYLEHHLYEVEDVYPAGCVATKEQVAERTEKFYESFDTNRDGIATYKEAVDWRTAKYNSKIEEDAEALHIASMLEKKAAAVNEKDVNGDGKVSVLEQIGSPGHHR